MSKSFERTIGSLQNIIIKEKRSIEERNISIKDNERHAEKMKQENQESLEKCQEAEAAIRLLEGAFDPK